MLRRLLRSIIFIVLVCNIRPTRGFISGLFRKAGNWIRGDRYKPTEMCELLASFERAEPLDREKIKYERYCDAIASLSGDKKDEKVELQCRIVSITASKILPLVDFNATRGCASFEGSWWNALKKQTDGMIKSSSKGEALVAVREATFELNDGIIELVRNENALDVVPAPTPAAEEEKSNEVDRLIDTDIYQYTHNTEYYCDTPDDFMILLHSLPPEKACSFSVYSFFLQGIVLSLSLSPSHKQTNKHHKLYNHRGEKRMQPHGYHV